MTIQWISPAVERQSSVLYKPLNENGEWRKASGEIFPFPHAPQYIIHRVELSNLEPNAEYFFKVLQYPEVHRFLTAPGHLDNELRFVVGGDMYHDALSFMINTCKKAALMHPCFALIGGDIAYAVKSKNQKRDQTERWIDWIKVWSAYMRTPKGYLIPVIAALGNHDIIGEFDQTPSQAATFSALFPMPGPQIYNVIDFGSYLSIFILDSGHAHPVEGVQTSWLGKVLQERERTKHKFAIYHVPAYPSLRTYPNRISSAIRKSWVPLFEKKGIQACFEHHDHAYKRTFPLIKNQKSTGGIIYIGDGCWGVELPRKFKNKRPYIAKFASIRHFISVTINPAQQRFQCVSDLGNVVDDCIQSVKK